MGTIGRPWSEERSQQQPDEDDERRSDDGSRNPPTSPLHGHAHVPIVGRANYSGQGPMSLSGGLGSRPCRSPACSTRSSPCTGTCPCPSATSTAARPAGSRSPDSTRASARCLLMRHRLLVGLLVDQQQRPVLVEGARPAVHPAGPDRLADHVPVGDGAMARPSSISPARSPATACGTSTATKPTRPWLSMRTCS